MDAIKNFIKNCSEDRVIDDASVLEAESRVQYEINQIKGTVLNHFPPIREEVMKALLKDIDKLNELKSKIHLYGKNFAK